MKRSRLTAMMLTAALAVTSVLSGCGGTPATTTAADNGAATTTAAPSGGETTTKAPVETTTGTIAEVAIEADALTYASGTVLRMACGYNNDKTGMSFTADLAGEGITLADGNTYHSGDLKPTWQAVEQLLDIKIEDKYQGNNDATRGRVRGRHARRRRRIDRRSLPGSSGG